MYYEYKHLPKDSNAVQNYNSKQELSDQSERKKHK